MTKLKSLVSKIFKSKAFSKVFACCLIFGVLASFLLIPVSAAESTIYQSIAPIRYNNFSGNVSSVAFPGAHSVSLFYKTSGLEPISRGYLNNIDYFEYPSTRILYKSWGGNSQAPYFSLYLQCNYSTVYVNGVAYQGSTHSNPTSYTLTDVYALDFRPSQASFVEGTNYNYYFDVMLYPQGADDLYNQGFEVGKQQGYSEGYRAGSQAGSESNYNTGYNAGYSEGYTDGRNSTDSENLGHNLLGDTLNVPFKALNGFTLYKSSSGFAVTLGLVVGGAICMTLFIAFLKMFAGG